MNRKNISRVYGGAVLFSVAGFLMLGAPVTSYAQTNQEAPSAAQSTVVAVIPLCLAKAEQVRNSATVKAAEDLTTGLAKEKSLRVLTQQEVVAAFAKAKLSYTDVTGKTLGDLDKAMPPHDVTVFLGPHPGKGGWFPYHLTRSSDLTGKSAMVYLGTGDTVTLNTTTITAEINKVVEAPKEIPKK